MQGAATIEEDDLRQSESLALNGRRLGFRALLCTFHLLTTMTQIENIAAMAHALTEADAN